MRDNLRYGVVFTICWDSLLEILFILMFLLCICSCILCLYVSGCVAFSFPDVCAVFMCLYVSDLTSSSVAVICYTLIIQSWFVHWWVACVFYRSSSYVTSNCIFHIFSHKKSLGISKINFSSKSIMPSKPIRLKTLLFQGAGLRQWSTQANTSSAAPAHLLWCWIQKRALDHVVCWS